MLTKIVIILSIVFAFRCYENLMNKIYLPKPKDTNLSYWITQPMSDDRLKQEGCTEITGCFGCYSFLDKNYTMIDNKVPDESVKYVLTSYPNQFSGYCITRIHITDPSITIYGLNINSTEEEIHHTMSSLSHFKYDESFSKENQVIMYTINAVQFKFFTENDRKMILIMATTHYYFNVLY